MSRVSPLIVLPLVIGTLVLGGCAATDAGSLVSQASGEVSSLVGERVSLPGDAADRLRRREAVSSALNEPLTADAAVRIALLNSPALQALLASRAADILAAQQAGRLANPVLSYERLRSGEEVEIGRALSIGLLELVLWPGQRRIARERQRGAELRLAAELVDRVTLIRQAWVEAVAAEQSAGYAKQVLESAQASAELARRMEAVGNFNRLMRARQESFEADARIGQTEATHRALAARETLVRALGLDDAQAARLRLPERLPDLPAELLTADAIAARAINERLDVRMAEAEWRATRAERARGRITSLTDIEAMGRRDTVIDEADSDRATVRGGEIELRLPLFDAGELKRGKQGAREQAAAAALEASLREASSSLREQHAAYRAAYERARQHREQLIPLRAAISDETLLRYNAMIIGVFELLADAREQITSVRAAIEAEREFWQAEAALQAALVGRPFVGGLVGAGTSAVRASGAAADAAGH